MAEISPTPVKENNEQLTTLSSIAESFSFIAKDLVEYVKLRTGLDITPQATEVAPTPTPTPTPEPEVETKVEEKPKSILGKLLGGITKAISPKIIIGALAAAGIVAALSSDFFKNFKESFSEFTSNLWDKMKEGFAGIGEWFSNLFSKGGEIISNLYDGVADFIKPFKDRVVEFFSNIGDYISEKFSSITSFFGKFEIFGKQDKPKVSSPPAPPKKPEIKKEDLEKARIAAMTKEERVAEFKAKQKRKPEVTKKVEYMGIDPVTGLHNYLKVDGLDQESLLSEIPPEKMDYTKAESIMRDQELQRAKSEVKNQQRSLDAMLIDLEHAKKSGKYDKKPEHYESYIKRQRESLASAQKKLKEVEGTTPSKVSGMEDTKAMIIQHEGKRNEPYKDSLGLWTVGVGHLIGDGKSLPPEMNRRFSDEEVMNMFEEDFAHHKKIAEQTPGYQAANEGGKAAFIDLSFNMGKWWPKWPTTKKLLANEQYADAAEAMKDSKWYDQVGNRAVTITNLVAQAGDGRGEAIASGSNEIAVTKRSMRKPETPVVVNAPSTTNNTMVNNDITPVKKDRTGTSNSLLARSV